MKILWFTNTSSLYQSNHPTNGGGWIESLEKSVRNVKDIDLAISFFHATDEKRINKDGVTYYPIRQKNNRKTPVRSILKKWRGDIGGKHIHELLRVVNDFQPDIIHVFGTEGLFSNIQKHVEIPVVIHLQGLMNPIADFFFAPGCSPKETLFDFHFLKQNILGNGLYFQYKRVRNQAFRERANLSVARFVMGRTAWDHSIVSLFNPSVVYFHVDEILRDDFLKYDPDAQGKKQEKSGKVIITSTLSGTSYKGIDLVLKTAARLTKKKQFDFHWNIVGIDNTNHIYKMFERKTQISGISVNINCLGVKTASELVLILAETDLFVHPSYIDNSPNSVCEAQMLGVPVIACKTGGIPTLIEQNVSGVLIHPGDHIELSNRILEVQDKKDFYLEVGKNGRKKALQRHNPDSIILALKSAYCQILKR